MNLDQAPHARQLAAKNRAAGKTDSAARIKAIDRVEIVARHRNPMHRRGSARALGNGNFADRRIAGGG